MTTVEKVKWTWRERMTLPERAIVVAASVYILVVGIVPGAEDWVRGIVGG